ncbi:MAG: hypothetical protein QNJ65_22175 [Xenococcaceae cyanobacterium MO_234.B1]|nr:hypothetical protein [Xenococcaceae cyanobacterium MO_234.B1]
MFKDLSQISQPSTVTDNGSQELQSSTMANNIFQTSKSLASPVPRLICYRYFNIDSVLDSRPTFGWLPCQEASKYIVQLSGKGLTWLKEVPATETTVTYDGETLLQPGENYIFKVEIDCQKSYVNSQVEPEVNIVEDVQKGIKTIEGTALPRQFKASMMAQLDGLLIARDEILTILQKATRQGSNSPIIHFIYNSLNEDSACKLLANACSCDDILDVLGDFASQLAAANITLGEYLLLSGIQKSLAKSLMTKGIDLALFAQNLEGAFQLTQFSGLGSLNSCESCAQEIQDCIQQGVLSPALCKHITCIKPECSGCPACIP